MYRDYKQELDDTVALLRKYMKSCRPQSFASLFPLYIDQVKRCDIYGIKREPHPDIIQYSYDEKIEQFGFGGV